MRRLAAFVLCALTAPACGNGSSSGALGQAHASAEGIDLGASPTSVELLAGDAFTLTPRLFARNQPLLGSAATDWTVDSDAVTLLREVTAAGERVRLVARQPGPATVTATQGALA